MRSDLKFTRVTTNAFYFFSQRLLHTGALTKTEFREFYTVSYSEIKEIIKIVSNL